MTVCLLLFNTHLLSIHALFPAAVICNRPLKFEAGTNAPMQLPAIFMSTCTKQIAMIY